MGHLGSAGIGAAAKARAAVFVLKPPFHRRFCRTIRSSPSASSNPSVQTAVLCSPALWPSLDRSRGSSRSFYVLPDSTPQAEPGAVRISAWHFRHFIDSIPSFGKMTGRRPVKTSALFPSSVPAPGGDFLCLKIALVYRNSIQISVILEIKLHWSVTFRVSHSGKFLPREQRTPEYRWRQG